MMPSGIWGGQEYDSELEYEGIKETERLRAAWVPNYWVANFGHLGYNDNHLLTQYRTYGDGFAPGVIDNKNWKISFREDGTACLVSVWTTYDDTAALQLVRYTDADGNERMTMVGCYGSEWPYSEIMTNAVYSVPAFLYAAEPTYGHKHSWGDWTDNGDNETHSRICAAEGCTVSPQTRSHRWIEGNVIEEPTCTQPGTQRVICADCGAVGTVSVEPLGHYWSYDWTYEDETTHIRECWNECGTTETGTHTWDKELEWVDDQYHAQVCTECYGRLKEEHEWGEVDVWTPATCKEPGSGQLCCTICERGNWVDIPKLDHNFEDWTPVDEKTHSRSCTYECGTTETGDHEWIVEVIQAPSCVARGQTRQYCPLCNYEQPGEMPIDPDAHDWGEWTVTRLPSVGIEGEEQRVCANAPTEHVETKRLPAIALPMEDTTISFVPSYEIPAEQTVSVHAYEVDLAHDGIAEGDPTVGQEVAPYEEYILNGLDGKKVETVFEIQPMVTVNDTTLPYEVPAGQSCAVTLFVGKENAEAIDQGKMFLVHITESGTVTYGKAAGNATIDVKKDDGGNYTGHVEFTTDSFSPFVLVSLPGGLEITLNGVGATNSCTVSFTEANQSFLCNLFIAVYDSSDRMLAVKSAGDVNLAANPQYMLEFTGTASYVKAFMLKPDGSLIPRCETESATGL